MMNYNSLCPVCSQGKGLRPFKWADYNLIHCVNCELDYCGEMVKKEIGGDSSPVNSLGIRMMADAFYRTQELSRIFSIKRKKIYENLLDRKCEKILEVGCGPGVFYKPWSELNVDWTGVDINPLWMKFGKENGVPISNKSLSSIKRQFDVVMAHQVIEHVEDPVAFIKEIKSLLRPGGLIHLELPNQAGLSAKLRKISSRFSYDYGFIQPPMHLRAYYKKTIKYLFEDLDLETKLIFSCANTDMVWGQVREYNLLQKFYYTFSGKLGMGSLLVGVAKLN